MNEPDHTLSYRTRRAVNWVPLGLAYAFFYMGRYNLTVAKSALGDAIMTKQEFGDIFAVGAWVYGLSFLFTGPFTDRIGGRTAMLLGTAGSIVCNIALGLVLYGNAYWDWHLPIFGSFVVLYALNMHFQSYGAIAIVSVKAPWFHVRERGTFGTIFGIMISLGIYFAFDWGYAIVAATREGADPSALGGMAWVFGQIAGDPGAYAGNRDWWLFFLPAAFMSVCWVSMLLWLRNTPGDAGYRDFDTGEESVSDTGERLPVTEVFRRIITHPVLLTVCGIEFCSGVLRNGIMHWYPMFAAEVGFKREFWVTAHWGLALLLCGVVGSFLTGWASDRFFQSRRAPMAAVLYLCMIAAVGLMAGTLGAPLWYAGTAVLLVSTAVIGVHGILSGTSTADFGGARNTGAAVGIVDGMVYLGTGFQSIVIGHLTPEGMAAKDPAAWFWWPVFLVPFAVVGFVLSVRIWGALPRKMTPAQKTESARIAAADPEVV